jgi:uncharacterized protein DUF3606
LHNGANLILSAYRNLEDGMAKKGILRKPIGVIKTLAKDAAVAVLTTRSAGKPSLADLGIPVPATVKRKGKAAKKRKQSSRERKQDRARVARGQKYEVRYEAKKTGKSKNAVKRAVKKVGASRKKAKRELER